MNLMKQPVSEILNDPVAKLKLGGWLFFWCGVLTVALGAAHNPFTVRGVCQAIGQGTTALVFGAWMLGAAQASERIAALEKENATLRTQQT